jgi:hypothetical protein
MIRQTAAASSAAIVRLVTVASACTRWSPEVMAQVAACDQGPGRRQAMPGVRFSRKRFVTVAVALLLGAAATSMPTGTASAASPIVHRASAGGPDACFAVLGAQPGCDGNYSWTASQFADGSASGHFTDRFATGDGVTGEIDCLSVAGNRAWASGVFTSGRFTDPDTGERIDLAGLHFLTSVQDNGRTSNAPADQVSRLVVDADVLDCSTQPDVEMFDTPEGQVIVS